MKANRVFLCFGVWAAGLCAASAAPPASAPATRPAATQPARAVLSGALRRKWREYKVAWAGDSLQEQSQSDSELVSAILAANPADVAPLRDAMTAEYERLSSQNNPDDFHCGRVASRLALAWTKVPQGKELSAVQVALNKKQTCEQVVRWAVRALEHFAGQIPDRYWQRFKAFLPGTAASMLSLIPSRAPWTDDPAAVRAKLVGLRGKLEALLLADQAGRQGFGDEFARCYKAIDALGKDQADRLAVRKLILAFRTAYNGRDDKAFIGLWPANHAATRSLKNRSLASRIPPELWKITRWEPVYVVVKGQLASVYVVSQYQAKNGKLQPVKLQRFPAKRDKKEGWKLN